MIIFTILCSFCFISSVHADVKCIYQWDYSKKQKVKIVLSSPDKNNRFTKINWSGLSVEAKVKFGNFESQRPKLKNNNTCPSISMYYGDVVGIEVWDSQERCQTNKNGFMQGNPKKCSKNIAGKLDTTGQSAENSSGEDQFRLKKKTNDSCIYIREYVKDNVVGSQSGKTSYQITILDSDVRGKIKKGGCKTVGRLSSCVLDKIDDEVVSAFQPNQGYDPFHCPAYIYTNHRVAGARDTYYFTVIGTGEGEDTDQSVVDEDSNTTHGKNYVKEEWLPNTEGPTAEECKKNPELVGCVKSSCEVIDTSGEVFKILKQILGYVQIGSVFAVLIFCVLDLGGAVASADDDAFRKARGKVMKRIIALILIFLVPLLVNFVINLVNLGACSEEDYDFIGNLFD